MTDSKPKVFEKRFKSTKVTYIDHDKVFEGNFRGGRN